MDSVKIAGSKFIIAVPVCRDWEETFGVLNSYLELHPAGFMVGVGGKLPILEIEPDRIDFGLLCRFIERLRTIHPNPIIAVDAEGGRIFNILQGISPLRSPRYYHSLKDPQKWAELTEDLVIHVQLLAEAGIRLNFAPLLDVPGPGYKGYAADDSRCISDSVEEVIHFGAEFIRTHQAAGVVCSGKHFPGYGHLTANPHLHLSREANNWSESRHIEPYRRLIEGNDLRAIMLGHSTTPYHSDAPASLAREAHNLLRDDLGFKGVTIADELFMGAVNDYYASSPAGELDGDPRGEQRAVDGWKLNDLLIVSYPIQNLDGTITGIPGGESRLYTMSTAVVNAINSGDIQKSDWETSTQRTASLFFPAEK